MRTSVSTKLVDYSLETTATFPQHGCHIFNMTKPPKSGKYILVALWKFPYFIRVMRPLSVASNYLVIQTLCKSTNALATYHDQLLISDCFVHVWSSIWMGIQFGAVNFQIVIVWVCVYTDLVMSYQSIGWTDNLMFVVLLLLSLLFICLEILLLYICLVVALYIIAEYKMFVHSSHFILNVWHIFLH